MGTRVRRTSLYNFAEGFWCNRKLAILFLIGHHSLIEFNYPFYFNYPQLFIFRFPIEKQVTNQWKECYLPVFPHGSQ